MAKRIPLEFVKPRVDRIRREEPRLTIQQVKAVVAAQWRLETRPPLNNNSAGVA